MKGLRECLTCISPTKLPRSDLGLGNYIAWFSQDDHYLSLLNSQPQLGWAIVGMKECLNSSLQSKVSLDTTPYCHTRIPGSRREDALPMMTRNQLHTIISPDSVEERRCLTTLLDFILLCWWFQSVLSWQKPLVDCHA